MKNWERKHPSSIKPRAAILRRVWQVQVWCFRRWTGSRHGSLWGPHLEDRPNVCSMFSNAGMGITWDSQTSPRINLCSKRRKAKKLPASGATFSASPHIHNRTTEWCYGWWPKCRRWWWDAFGPKNLLPSPGCACGDFVLFAIFCPWDIHQNYTKLGNLNGMFAVFVWLSYRQVGKFKFFCTVGLRIVKCCVSFPFCNLLGARTCHCFGMV